MLHAIGKILYFLIWVMLFRMAKREIEDTPQPPKGGAGKNQNNSMIGQ